MYTIFLQRKPIGIWDQKDTELGLVTSRILWLSGTDPENSNTKERFIYIHGTAGESVIGEPRSRGCVVMKNRDIVDLYELVDVGTQVIIENK